MMSITANLRQLTNFSGRERRGRFWPYVGVAFAGIFVLQGIFSAVLVSWIFAGVDPARSLPAAMLLLVGSAALSSLIFVLLLAAAVSRRLHDSGLNGYWGLLPVPFLAYGLGAMPFVVQEMEAGQDMTLFSTLFINNALYMAALITLVVLLCRPSVQGPNRYGEEPAE